MGIPSYYKKLCDTIPGLLSRKNPFSQCQYMWIDFNCMVYHCLRRPGAVAYQGEDTRLVWEAEFLKQVCAYLEHVVAQCKPTKGVFVAVDGVVPLAKMRQQRLRRFKSHWTHAEELRLGKSGTPSHLRWDTNAITPGTAFLDSLGAALKETAKRHPHWTISDGNEPGEGEQKVMAALRALPASETDGHILYGLDADLILLALLQERANRHIALFRESVEFGAVQYDEDNKEEYSYMSIPLLASAIVGKGKATKAAKNQFLLDYCMLMSFLGNDFLPHGLSFTLRNDGHNHLLAFLTSQMTPLVDERNGWSIDSLIRCFKWLASREETLLKKSLATKHKLQWLPAQGTGAERDYDEWVKTPLRVFDEVCLVQSFEGHEPRLRHDWQTLYQERYLHGIKGRCEEEYIRGLQWVFSYMMGHKVSVEWMYPWHLPPLWSNLLASCEYSKDLPAQYPIGEYVRPQEQLALVLPHQSWWLIRDKALTDLPARCPSLWPTSFELFYAGKRAMWECEALIPLFLPARLRSLLRDGSRG